MADNVTTAKFTVDISDLKKNIQEANRQVKLANAEFKAATAGMDSWSKSADGLSAKISQLQKNLSSQKTILSEYQKQLKLIEDQYGKDSKQADEMRVKIYNQEAVVKNTEAALGKYEKQLEEVEKETKKAGNAYEELDKKIRDQEKALEEAKKEYASVVLEQGKSSKAAQELAGDIEKLSKELEEDKKAFDDAGKAADELAGDLDDTSKEAKDAGDAANKASDGFTVMKGVLADLAATAIKAVVQGLKDIANAAADAWKGFDEGRDTIIKLTGASGDLKDSLMGSYSNVSKSILADSQDIGEAIGEVNTRFGLTGDQLDKVSEKYLKFADITDSDVIGSIDDTQKALSAYGKGTESINGFLDALAATSQKTGVQTSTLSSGIISNATAFQEMGLSLEQAVAFMGQLEKSGTNSETVLNGMRKALKNSTKDGKSMNQALLDLQKEIEGNTKGTKGLQAAYDLFGKSGDQIYGAIKNGTLSFKDLASAMEDTSGAVDNTYNATLDATDRIKLQIQGLKTDFAVMIDEFLQEYGPDIEDLINTIGQQIKDLLPGIKEWLEDLLPKIKEFIPTLEELIPKVVDFFQKIVEHGDEIISVITRIAAALAATKVLSVISSLLPAITQISGAVKDLWTAFSGGQSAIAILGGISAPVLAIVAAVAALAAAFAYLWETNEEFKSSIMGTWDEIRSKFEEAGKTITDAINSLGFEFEDVWEALKAGWDWLCNTLAPVFEAIFENLANLIEGVVDIITGVVQTVVGIIKGFKDGDWSLFVDGIESIFLGFLEVILAPFETLFETFGDVIDEFEKLWDSVWTAIGEFFDETIENIGQIFSDLWDGIVAVWEAASGWFDENVITPISDFFSEMWEGLKQFAQDAWDGICEIFEGAEKWFTDVFQGVSDAIEKIFNGIVAIVKFPINTMIGLLNKFIDGINGIEIPDWVPGVGGKSLNIKHINELEKGGILKKGQTGFLEGNGAEAVVPLDQNQKWIASITKELRRQLETSSMIGGSGKIVNGGDTIYNFNQTNNSPKALSRLEIYRQTKNQLAYANGGGLVHA